MLALFCLNKGNFDLNDQGARVFDQLKKLDAIWAHKNHLFDFWNKLILVKISPKSPDMEFYDNNFCLEVNRRMQNISQFEVQRSVLVVQNLIGFIHSLV